MCYTTATSKTFWKHNHTCLFVMLESCYTIPMGIGNFFQTFVLKLRINVYIHLGMCYLYILIPGFMCGFNHSNYQVSVLPWSDGDAKIYIYVDPKWTNTWYQKIKKHICALQLRLLSEQQLSDLDLVQM